MKRLLSAIAFMAFATTAHADYTMVVPQKVGGGTAVWAEIIAKELEKKLGESVVIDYRPGARDIPGFDDFETTLQHDPKTIMVSHGGNAESFLQEQVQYNYSNYRPVGLMNLDIIVAKRKDVDVYNAPIAFSSGSGMTPEAMAMTMLICGPDMTTEQYISCFNEKISWVKGFDGGERRLAFQRGELSATRETPAAYKKHVESDEMAELWFTHGIIGPDNTRLDDPEYPGYRFEDVFKTKWGVEPTGAFYESYALVRAFRDGFQKALWMSKDSPHADDVIKALNEMVQDPESNAAIEKDAGKYPWVIGADAEVFTQQILSLVKEQPLKDLVSFSEQALGLASVYKPELVK
jgi:hypothetical protein